MTKRETSTLLCGFVSRLAATFGAENTALILRALAEEMGGCRFTVPSIKDLERANRDMRIRRNFTGANYEELAIRYDLTPNHIRRIIADDDRYFGIPRRKLLSDHTDRS